MSTTVEQRQKLWSYDEYDRLIATGLLDNARVELIGGRLIVMTPANPPHDTSVSKTGIALQAVIGPEFYVREEKTLALDIWDGPQPDLAVVRGKPDDYATRRPTVDDTLLVVEVSDSSLVDDQTTKAAIYAAAGIEVYWIVNIPGRILEVRRRPVVDSATGMHRYADLSIYTESDQVSVPVPGANARVSVAELLPTM
jgi:Uma2 family endonuclease